MSGERGLREKGLYIRDIPPGLAARVPAEQRGPGRGRDSVRLLVSRGASEVSLHAFRELPGLLHAGDVLVVNTSATLPAAVDGRLGGEELVVHFSTRGEDGRWSVELRDHAGARDGVRGRGRGGEDGDREREPDRGGQGVTRPRAGGPAGAVVELPGGWRLVLEEPVAPGADRLWWARPAPTQGRPQEVPALLRSYGRPIRYAYTERDQPLSAYQTVFAVPRADGAGSAEMPSAGRPFTAELVAELVRRGVCFAPLTLHTGVASQEAHEPPYPERYEVPATTARLVNAARAAGGRVIGVGTTAVRALESAADGDGVVRAAGGWTGLVVTPERGVRVVDGLLTGLHQPGASHLLMLEAVAGREAVRRGYASAVANLCLWHEFGDVHLLLKDENGH
ncbi:S-adenosylmethionine:tRNA ribosyltransferase-isomerase [Streptomyces sp. NBC_00347]|uniref:S-adenosylmethionine:tRNA ribosyltransferase-isomerase n=1 Tax=Streptomyces sp. NBC_00347 TaxID=2975721 RepID=UPI00224E2AE6|nr:S-adenosylmethionine:tRNA ribosyltransferase-isomerase [Streptomyces sp. NBC_00347]MCX5124933.1 S-adenosylmethionine:tRNA ribosyltransferase-isomerase [Streptomyces sp. NBC_00347]